MSMQDASVAAMVWRQIAAHGETVILRRKDRGIWQAITWNALGAQARAIGMALKQAGLRSGEVAGLLAETAPDWIAADLGILGAGCVSLGLYPTDPAATLGTVLRHSGCRVLFVENEEQLDKALQVRAACPALARIVIMDMKGLREFADPMCESLAAFTARGAAADRAAPGAWEAGIATITPADIAVLAATAGTGDIPRLAMLSHGNIMTQIVGAAALTGQTEADSRIAFLPMSQVAERVFGLYVALYCGTISNLVESPETVPENLAEVRPTVMFAIPRIWEKLHAAVSVGVTGATRLQRAAYRGAMALAERRVTLLAAGAAVPGWLEMAAGLASFLVLKPVQRAIGLDRVRLAFVGAAPVSAELVRWYAATGIALRQVYGTSECGGVAAMTPADKPRADAVGAPVPYGELALSDAGEVLIRGPHVCVGLWADGASRPAADAQGWLHTGDLGRMEGGQLVLTGRVGEAIATAGGADLMPAAFENALKLSPFIADAILVGGARDGVGCLVVLEFDVVEKWAQERNVPFTSSASLARAPEIVALITNELRARAPALKLGGFRVIGQRIEAGDPEMTPVMRLRRHLIIERYRDLIEDIYRAA